MWGTSAKINVGKCLLRLSEWGMFRMLRHAIWSNGVPTWSACCCMWTKASDCATSCSRKSSIDSGRRWRKTDMRSCLFPRRRSSGRESFWITAVHCGWTVFSVCVVIMARWRYRSCFHVTFPSCVLNRLIRKNLRSRARTLRRASV